jgi:predicted ABC-type ATPase
VKDVFVFGGPNGRENNSSFQIAPCTVRNPRAVARVAQRVRGGGHGIPDNVIRRRYEFGLRNLYHLYLPLFHTALIIDNSDERGTLIAEHRDDGPIVIHDAVRWYQIVEATR